MSEKNTPPLLATERGLAVSLPLWVAHWSGESTAVGSIM